MSRRDSNSLLKGAMYLSEWVLHQYSRLFYWVRPLPERAIVLADFYLFPAIVMSGTQVFGQIRLLNLLLGIVIWVYYLGTVVFVIIAKMARNKTWQGLGTGKYTPELIERLSRKEGGLL